MTLLGSTLFCGHRGDADDVRRTRCETRPYGFRRPNRAAWLLGALLLAGITMGASNAHARSQSAPYRGCTGCHSGSGQLDITLVPDGELTPGQAMDFTLTVAAPNISRAGFFATADGVGTFTAGTSSQLAGEDLTHRGAATASGGRAEFRFSWTPPAEAGGGDIYLFALGANGNNSTSGDTPGDRKFSFAWGCEGVELFQDGDRDGFGTDLNTSRGCEARDGWSLVSGDCNIGNDSVYPGAREQCNDRDDDCDGEIDEDTEPFPLYPDADGDGHGDPQGEPIIGCTDEAGYVAVADDCDDNDASAYPGAEEVCDGRDNNCDGRIDENAKARCGVGWCERLAPSCYSDACYPGEPQAETCNGLDDDCDGVVDNNVSCPAGEACFEARCIPSEDAAILAEMEPQAGAGPTDPSTTAGSAALAGSPGDVTDTAGADSTPAAAGAATAPDGANPAGQPATGEDDGPPLAGAAPGDQAGTAGTAPGGLDPSTDFAATSPSNSSSGGCSVPRAAGRQSLWPWSLSLLLLLRPTRRRRPGSSPAL